MTNEESIKNLKQLKSFHNGSYGEAINLAIEALEKQIPMKPINDCCPNCKSIFLFKDGEVKGNVCKWCGQAIDWSDE